MAGIKERWKVSSCGRRCAHTEVKFTLDEPIITALFEDVEQGGYYRKDFSLKAWKEVSSKLPTPFSKWQTLFRKDTSPAPNQAKVMDSVESVFRHWLQHEASEEKSELLYVLALMLERKRILVEQEAKRSEDGEQLLRIYEFRKTGEICLIRDPEVSLEEVGKIQLKVIEDLEFLE